MRQRTHTRPARRPQPVHRRRRWLGATAALVLVASSLSIGLGIGPLGHITATATAIAADSCPSDGTGGCVQSLPCANGPCPTVDANPVDDVNDGQYITLTATNFPTGDTIRIALCSTSSTYSPDPSDPYCLWGNWETSSWERIQQPVAVDSANANRTVVATPVFFDESGEGNSVLPTHDILNNNPNGPGMFCDNAPDTCALEVTEETGTGLGVGNGPSDSNQNTLIFPLSYAAQKAGCPTSDPQVQLDASFSVEHFIPTAVDATCTGANGVIGISTANDNESIVKDFKSGGAPLAFLDNPSDPTVEGQLAGTAYAYIPVAVSSTVVAFLAGELDGALAFPVTQFDLTPNMLAGLITSSYQGPTGSLEDINGQYVSTDDDLIPPLDCSNLVGCYEKKKANELENEPNFTTWTLLNPPAPGEKMPTAYGSFMSNVASGASYAATNWICSAPNTPFNVSVDEENPPGGQNPVSVSVTDPNIASTTLTTAPSSTIWPPPGGAPWVFPSCQGYSTFPALTSASDVTDYEEASNPAFQAKDIRSYAYLGNSVPGSTVAFAGFGLMDASEAGFYGLNDASLLNADGNFSAPTEANVEAAASSETACPIESVTCPAGTYSLDSGSVPSGSPDAYPLPDVTYALVSTTPQPADQATALKQLLSNLVGYSHTPTTPLPQGFAPLPDDMYQAALADISQDIVAEPATKGSSSGSGTSGGSQGGSGGGVVGGSGTPLSSELGNPLGTALPLSFGSTSPSGSSGSASSGSGGSTGTNGSSPGSASSSAPTGFLLLSLDEASRYLLPILLILAFLCLLAGSLMFGVPALRARRRTGSG